MSHCYASVTAILFFLLSWILWEFSFASIARPANCSNSCNNINQNNKHVFFSTYTLNMIKIRDLVVKWKPKTSVELALMTALNQYFAHPSFHKNIELHLKNILVDWLHNIYYDAFYIKVLLQLLVKWPKMLQHSWDGHQVCFLRNCTCKYKSSNYCSMSTILY